MHPEKSRRLKPLTVLLALVAVSASIIAGSIQSSSNPRKKSAGPDGGGVLPFVGPPSTHVGIVQQFVTPTLGQVLDAQRAVIAGTLVVVTHPAIGVVGVAVTDENGLFVVDLPKLPNLELALPDENVAGISVIAGQSVLIIVP